MIPLNRKPSLNLLNDRIENISLARVKLPRVEDN